MAVYLFKTEDYYGGNTKIFLSQEEAQDFLHKFVTSTEGKTDALIEVHHPFPVVKVIEDDGTVSQQDFYLIGTQEAGDNCILCETECSDEWPLDLYAVDNVVGK